VGVVSTALPRYCKALGGGCGVAAFAFDLGAAASGCMLEPRQEVMQAARN
jgi:hypothetical protein